MHLAVKAHWTDLREVLKTFSNPAYGIEFHENEIDIDDKTRYEGQFGTITTVLSKRKNMSLAFHVPVLDTDPTSFDEEIRNISIGRVKRTIDLAASVRDELGSKKPIVNAHFLSIVLQSKQLRPDLKKRALHIAGKSARELKSYARKNDVEFTLENNPPVLFKDEGKNVFGILSRCAEDMAQWKCNTCLDISHAYMTCFYFENRTRTINLPDIGRIDKVFLPDLEADIKYYKKIPPSCVSLKNFIEVLGNSIKHIHLNDAIGYFHEGLVLGDGDIDFKHVLPLINKDIMLVLELKKAHLYPQRISESLDYLKKQGIIKNEF